MQQGNACQRGLPDAEKAAGAGQVPVAPVWHDIQAESNTAMPADFLMEQMEWREAVMEASQGGDHHELEHLHNRLRG
jgi:hypothetical protein